MDSIRITQENIPTLQERIKALRRFVFGDKYDANNPKHQLSNDEKWVIGNDTIEINFPNTGANSYSIDDFLRYTDDLGDIKVEGHYIFAGSTVQVPINYPVSGPMDIVFKSANYTMRMVFAPFLVNLIDTQWGNFTKREYYAIEIFNPYGIPDYMYPEVRKMVNRILYYLSNNAKKNFHIHPIPNDNTQSWTEMNQGVTEITLEKLPFSSPLLRMYREALSRSNNIFARYIQFYKMIEVVSPLALKEKMYHELFDELKNHSGQYNLNNLTSIEQSVNRYNKTIQEAVLAATVLKHCVYNIKDLYTYLPDPIKQKCAKDLNMDISKDLSNVYSSGLSVVYDKVGSILYATRRGIAHFKSVYQFTGDECKEADMDQLNVFMEKVCSSLITWNNKQPDHIRIKD